MRIGFGGDVVFALDPPVQTGVSASAEFMSDSFFDVVGYSRDDSVAQLFARVGIRQV